MNNQSIKHNEHTHMQNFDDFKAAINEILPPEHIITDPARLIALATDASFYTKTPQLLLKIPSIATMKKLMSIANYYKIPLTFRAAGTSLSGQAITDSVLVMLTSDWNQYEVLEEGAAIALAPGIIGAKANRILAKYNRKIGPDPASINACKIGGIAANNASGMCCGVKNNSYHTLRDIHLVLPDGSEINTADHESVTEFRRNHASMLSALSSLRSTLLQNTKLVEKIRYQYRIKNTMGYGLNALLDFDDPLDILTHLMIGSEGTLGFIANITYNTIPLPRVRQTALYLFDDFEHACAVIPALKTCNVNAVELMDARALKAVAPLLNEIGVTLFNNNDVALLIDVGRQTQTDIHNALHRVRTIIHDQGNGRALCDFTDDPSTIDKLWNIRKGLFPAVGAVRPIGTTVIIEDIAFPLDELAFGLNALVELLEQFGYYDSIIFGHALDGNVHFVFSQGFNHDSDRLRYNEFMHAISAMVTQKFNGSLKAEHGTGRNMAPFLSAQWGVDGVAIMRTLKQIIDPNGILNPGVILNENPNAHVTHLKPMPAIDESIDACIECGFCEPQCPSSDYTLSPRQRIALQRRQYVLAQQGNNHVASQIDAQFDDLVIDSCAATGMCATACPVGINTGAWVKRLRSDKAKHQKIASLLAKHTNMALSIARFAINSGHKVKQIIGDEKLNTITNALSLPHFLPSTPPAAQLHGLANNSASKSLPEQENSKLVYLLSCPSKVFGPNRNETSITKAILSLCEKAGVDVILSTNNNCCGQPWASEGYTDLATQKQRQWLANANLLSENGRWPVITDNSACAYMSKVSETGKPNNVRPIDVSEYLLKYIVPKLHINKMMSPLLLHIGCSSTHLDSGAALIELANICSQQVHIPMDISCCGFAGTKGFTQPELNQHALAPLKHQVPEGCNRGVTSSSTCAIGLTQHSGVAYSHIAVLLDELSQTRF